MAFKKSTDRWVKAKGKWALNVDGAFSFGGARYSLATYQDEHGLFEVYAFFNSGKKVNETEIETALGKDLKELFNAGKYICVVENGTGKRIDRQFIRVEFYARCQRPDPEVVGMLKDTIHQCLEDHGYIEET